ncbi:hypothetical protein [Clostridiisalibacter paucivorans]|uniref:hypothetical protein n=1 Tax=Clostridiisalibacter paucivorans TaxID=408753 RepID=UPI0004795BF8|nr:hypothetical protein [Clostridiisalibacter paucivorans]
MPNKNRLIYMLLGMGIGIVLTSIVAILNPVIKYRDYSQQDLEMLAREYMIEEMRENRDEERVSVKTKVDRQDSNTNEEITEIEFEIDKGENSKEVIEKLYEKGIIENVDDFTDRVVERNLQKRFQYGIYEVTIPIDYDSLLDRITIK